MARKKTKKATKIKKKRGRPKKKKEAKKKIEKTLPVNTFENVETFSKSFRPAIRVRAIRPSKQRRINLVLGNLLVFVILFVLSSVLYVASTIDFYKTLFFLLSLIFGALSIAFLIVLIAFVFLKVLKE